MVQIIKEIRAKAVAVLRGMSAELQRMAEAEGIDERQDHFIAACQPFLVSPEVFLS